MGEQTDGRIAELINAAVLAGAYQALYRSHPDAQGLQKLRIKWSARVAALADEVCREAVG